MRPVLFEGMLFGMPIYLSAYSTLNYAALVIALIYGTIALRRRSLKYSEIALLAVAMAGGFLVGARLYYAVVNWSQIVEAPHKLFALKLVNFGLYGGLFGSLGVFAAWGKWRFKDTLSLWTLLDQGVLPLALALSMSKLGCFLNGCCYGGVTDLPWGLYFPKSEPALLRWLNPSLIQRALTGSHDALRHPTQVYEVIVFLASAILVMVLVGLSGRKTPSKGTKSPVSTRCNLLLVPGNQALLYLILITLGRWLVNPLRDYPHMDPLTNLVRGPVTYGVTLVLLIALITWRMRCCKRPLFKV